MPETEVVESELFGTSVNDDESVIAAEEEAPETPSLLDEVEPAEDPAVAEGATASEPEVAPEAEPQETQLSALAAVTQHIGTESPQPNREADLERQLALERSRWSERDAAVNEMIAATNREPEPATVSIREQLSTPEVARLFRQAQDSEDGSALPDLILSFLEKAQEGQSNAEVTELKAEMVAMKQTSAQEANVHAIKTQSVSALTQLAQMGKTQRDLAQDVITRGEDSTLWQNWNKLKGITHDAQLMVILGEGIASLVDKANANIKGKAGASTPANRPVVTEASTAARTPASTRGTNLTATPEQIDPADQVMNALIGAGGGSDFKF